MSESTSYTFTVTVDVPAEEQPVTGEYVGRQVEKMIENNSDWTAWVEEAS